MDNSVSSVLFNQYVEDTLEKCGFKDRLGEICLIIIKDDDVGKFSSYDWMIQLRTNRILRKLSNIYRTLDIITQDQFIDDFGEIGDSWVFDAYNVKGIRVRHKYWDYNTVVAFREIIEALCKANDVKVGYINKEY